MIRKKAPERTPEGDNHHPSPDIVDSLRKEFRDTVEEIRDLIGKGSSNDQTTLFIARSLLDPDRAHKPRMTRLYFRAVKPASLADMSASVLDPEVQAGNVSLGQVRRESYYDHMLSVGGFLAEKASDLAAEQLRVSEGQESFEGAEVGKGL